MGVGYSASALHRVSYLDMPSMPGRPVIHGEDPLTDLLAEQDGEGSTVYRGPIHFALPLKADILAWRNRINDKYRGQLGEDLLWDEDSLFEQSEDITTSADVLLRYVAAFMDKNGPNAIHALVNTTKPNSEKLREAFVEANRRGLSGRFPQLLLGARYWFPFQRHMIMEEPDWLGTVERYGSSFRVMDELLAIRTFIRDADPGVATRAGDPATPAGSVLAAAWQASDTMVRLCTAAVDQHLPFWTTG